MSRDLPAGSILEIERGLYCTSPAFTAYLYSRGRSVPEIAALLMELLGTYSLPHNATLSIARGKTWSSMDGIRLPNSASAETHLSGLDTSAETDPEINDVSDTPLGAPDGTATHRTHGNQQVKIEQTHYSCEPAATKKQLRAIAKWTKSSRDHAFRRAVDLVAPNSASPAETIQYCMLGFPMQYGGFNCAALPDGMLLNHRIDFTHDAVLMSSGMPYAVADCFIPAANVDVEYNGTGHEELPARIHDGNRNNGLRCMGINVIVIQRDQMRNIQALEAIARTIYRFAHMRFRYQGKGHRAKQANLLNALRGAVGLKPV